MHLATDPRAHLILDAIDDFADLRTSYANAAREFPAPPVADQYEAARLFREGEDLAPLAEALATNNRRSELISAAESIRSSAQAAHDSAFLTFLSTHQAQISAVVVAGYREIVEKVKGLLPALSGVHTLEDTLGKPEATVAFVELDQLAKDFDAQYETGRTLLWPVSANQGISTNWPFLTILRDYETAWPNFHRFAMNVEHVNTSTRYTVPAEAAPWSNTFTLLRDIASRDLKLWAPTRDAYDAALDRLDRLTVDRQKEDMRVARAGVPVDISPKASHYQTY